MLIIIEAVHVLVTLPSRAYIGTIPLNCVETIITDHKTFTLIALTIEFLNYTPYFVTEYIPGLCFFHI